MDERARRAEWRRSPDDPTTLLGLLRRWPGEVLRAQEIPESITMSALGAIWVFALFLVAALPVAGGAWMAWRFGWFAGLLALVAIFLFLAFLEGRAGSRPHRPSSAPSPFPAPVRMYPVAVAIRYRGALTGIDVASAAFVDGWLFVEGKRTTFSLRGNDGRSSWRDERLTVGFPSGETLTLKALREASIRVPEEGFQEAVCRWLAEREYPSGESVLPPLETHWTMRRGWTGFALCGALLAVASAVALTKADGLAHALLVILFVLGGAAYARGVVVRNRQREADRRARALRALP